MCHFKALLQGLIELERLSVQSRFIHILEGQKLMKGVIQVGELLLDGDTKLVFFFIDLPPCAA